MKKLVLLVCVFLLLILATGVASAHNSQPGQFSITGITTSYNYRIMSNDRITLFNVTAEGDSTGYLEGPFTFKEWGSVNLNPETYDGSGKGVNTGLITITKLNDPATRVIIWYGGQLDAFAQQVRGTWHVVNGQGGWDDLEGHGNYTGSAGVDPFTVVFTGDFD
jgi:hypothetical protein